MTDRQPLFPGRVRLEPVEGQENTYDMIMADAPTDDGTPLNKATLLSDETAALYGLEPETAVPDDVLELLGDSPFSVGDVRYTYRSTLGPRWALCNGAAFPTDEYPKLAEMFPRDYTLSTSWPADLTQVPHYTSGFATCPIGYWRVYVKDSSANLICPSYSRDGINWVEMPALESAQTLIKYTYCNGMYIIYHTNTSSPAGLTIRYTTDIESNAWTEIVTTTGATSLYGTATLYGANGYFYISDSYEKTYVWYGKSLSSFTKIDRTFANYWTPNTKDFAASDGSFFFIISGGASNRSDSLYHLKGGSTITELVGSTTTRVYEIIDSIVEIDTGKVVIFYHNNDSGRRATCTYDLSTSTTSSHIFPSGTSIAVPKLFYNGYFVSISASGGSRWKKMDQSDIETFSFDKPYIANNVLPSVTGYPAFLYNTTGKTGGVAICANYLPTASTGNKGMNAFIKVKDGE